MCVCPTVVMCVGVCVCVCVCVCVRAGVRACASTKGLRISNLDSQIIRNSTKGSHRRVQMKCVSVLAGGRGSWLGPSAEVCVQYGVSVVVGGWALRAGEACGWFVGHSQTCESSGLSCRLNCTPLHLMGILISKCQIVPIPLRLSQSMFIVFPCSIGIYTFSLLMDTEKSTFQMALHILDSDVVVDTNIALSISAIHWT